MRSRWLFGAQHTHSSWLLTWMDWWQISLGGEANGLTAPISQCTRALYVSVSVTINFRGSCNFRAPLCPIEFPQTPSTPTDFIRTISDTQGLERSCYCFIKQLHELLHERNVPEEEVHCFRWLVPFQIFHLFLNAEAFVHTTKACFLCSLLCKTEVTIRELAWRTEGHHSAIFVGTYLR